MFSKIKLCRYLIKKNKIKFVENKYKLLTNLIIFFLNTKLMLYYHEALFNFHKTFFSLQKLEKSPKLLLDINPLHSSTQNLSSPTLAGSFKLMFLFCIMSLLFSHWIYKNFQYTIVSYMLNHLPNFWTFKLKWL